MHVMCTVQVIMHGDASAVEKEMIHRLFGSVVRLFKQLQRSGHSAVDEVWTPTMQSAAAQLDWWCAPAAPHANREKTRAEEPDTAT